ncbi:unnamed protein product [Camellia sinensis]
MGVLGFTKSFNGGIFYIIRNRTITYSFENLQRRRALCSDSNKFNGHDSILPVLIVGAGPVGLVLSLLLTKLVVLGKALNLAKQVMIYIQFLSQVFRKLDGLAEDIQRSQPPVDLWRKFIYCTSLYGSILGSVDHMQPQDLEQVVSPVSVAHFSQYKLTSLLLKKLDNLNFQVRTSENLGGLDHRPVREKEILMGHECVSVDSTDNCVKVTVSFLKEGQYTERTMHCSILVGADGAGSTVRNLVGINLRGEKDLQKLVSVHFSSRELGHYLLNERPGMLFFIFNTEAIGVLVAHDLKEGEFVLQIPFYPPQQKLEDFTSEICERLIFELVGQALADIDVIDIKPWVMHAEVAEKYMSCDNRIILAGDAAHRFPPAGGFGMNTGIQDAHNLAWKLASVVKGISPYSILQTYEMERRPIALFNTALSVQNFRAAMAVPAALGLDPTIANSVHRVINRGVGSLLPYGLQKGILDGIFTIGRAQLSGFVLNENNPLGSSRLAKLKRIFEEGKSLQLQFPAEDLGFRYLKGALVPNKVSTWDVPETPTGRRRDYVPSADPGSRLPHMTVRASLNPPSEDTFDMTQHLIVTISTLNLVSEDKLEFLLIIAPVESSYRLAHAAFKVAEEFKVSARACVMWPHGVGNGAEVGSEAALKPWENYIDVVEVKQTSTSLSWWDICQMTDRGAILVRPDEHIAWRVKSRVVGDPTSEMRRVFSIILGVVSTQI